MSKKVALTLSDEALEVIDNNAKERERGEWVSGVILGWNEDRDIAGAGALERVEARLGRLEDFIRRLVGKWVG